MTTRQLDLFNCLYLVMLIAVSVFTRATTRRIVGALTGAAVAGLAGLGILAFGEGAGWWHMAITWKPYFLTLFWIDEILCAYVFLITWRIARRFGERGLAVAVFAAAIIGPPRDQSYMRRFPEWGHYGPGITPVLAISANYIVLLLVGHGVMRLVAGSARKDRLAHRPWDPA